MEAWTSEETHPDDLMEMEKKYAQAVASGASDISDLKFQVACLLVKSRYSADIERGISLLEDLYNDEYESGNRDYVYFLAVAHNKLHNYDSALKYINALSRVEPRNHQASKLKKEILEAQSKEKQKAAMFAGGAGVAVAAVVGLGLAALLKK